MATDPQKNVKKTKRTPVLEIKNLSFSYHPGNLVLKNINFDVQEGDFLGLIGPNGGGKSTLLKLIIGTLPLQQGSIKILGESLNEFKRWHEVGYVSQKATHFEKRFPATVEEVILMGMARIKKLFHLGHLQQQQKVQEVLEDVGMLPYRLTPIHNLSGGQQQRVLIARALATSPKLLVLDEPTVGIDIKAQEEFYLLLQKLRQEKKLTIILVSHDIDVVATQANTFACLNQSLVYHGKPETFIKQDYMERLYGKNLRLILHGH